MALEGQREQSIYRREGFRMKAIKLLSLVVTCMCGATLCLATSGSDKPITVRVASYNVEFGKSATPEQELKTHTY